MCMGSKPPKAPDPAPPPPPPAPPPPEPIAVQPASTGSTGSNMTAAKRKGTSSLRIDLAQSNSGGGSGLNIPN